MQDASTTLWRKLFSYVDAFNYCKGEECFTTHILAASQRMGGGGEGRQLYEPTYVPHTEHSTTRVPGRSRRHSVIWESSTDAASLPDPTFVCPYAGVYR